MSDATKKRLIDANEAYEAVIDLSGQAETKSAYAAFWKAGKEIQKLPTVDAVEVVRCKDCKFAKKPYTPQMQELYRICTTLHHTEIHMGKDAFCSYGERKDNNEM